MGALWLMDILPVRCEVVLRIVLQAFFLLFMFVYCACVCVCVCVCMSCACLIMHEKFFGCSSVRVEEEATAA
jgi:hypothetical protein